jgi:recombination protein U
MEVFYQGNLVLLELKSVLKKSLPLGNIKESQIEGLTKAFNRNARHMFVGFLINFRDYEETYFMSIEQFNQYISNEERKSIPIEFCRDNCILIKQEKKKVRYRYDIEDFIKELTINQI